MEHRREDIFYNQNMITSGQSILRELDVNECEVAELEYVLGSACGGGWGGDRSDHRSLLFPGDQKSYAVKLVYDAKHRLKDALAGPALNEDQLTEIKRRIVTDLRTVEALRVGNWVLFAPIPVTGVFRYLDDFQILPVPEKAPRPNYLLADHPFLLQFKYIGSQHPFVDSRRRISRGIELELLLAGLISSHIHGNRDQSSQWVVPPRPQINIEVGAHREVTSMLCQRCYVYPELKGVLGDFTPIGACSSLRLIPSAEFQNRLGISGGQVLDLPENFGESISAYHHLTGDQKMRFGNACHWVQHSARTFRDSQSASYIALALAIESLMPVPESGKVCACCRRGIGKGPTQQFKEFVGQFAPEIKLNGAEAKRLYKIRSKLAHGQALFISDRELFAPALGSFEDWQNGDRLHRVVRTVLANWLQVHVRAAAASPQA